MLSFVDENILQFRHSWYTINHSIVENELGGENDDIDD